MTIRAYGDDAVIELFEHHLVITRRRPGFIVDGSPAEQFIPFSSIKFVEFVRPGFIANGRIVLTLAGVSTKKGDECAVSFPKSQVRQFEDVLRTVRQAIATPSIEHLATMAAQRRERIVESQPSSDQSGQEIIASQPRSNDGATDRSSYRTEKPDHLGTARQQPNNDRPFKYTLSVWWRDIPPFGKISLFVFALYLFIVLFIAGGSSTDQSFISDDATSNAESDSTQITEGMLTGNWIMTPKGGEDGATNCQDFNAPALFKLNKKTAKLLSFSADGSYRALFAYRTPSGSEHTQTETANWSIEDAAVRYQDFAIQAPIGGGASDTQLEPVSSPGSNQLIIGSGDAAARYVRCTGSVDDIFPAVLDEPSVKYEPVPYAPSAADFAAFCSDQGVINSTSTAYKKLITQALLASTAAGNQMGIDDALMGAFIIRERLARLRLRFLNIRSVEVDDSNEQFVKLQCNANVRVTEPVEGSNGNWSQYIQFNNSRYSLKIPKNADGVGEIAILAELPPLNVSGNVETGSE